mgnify:CR=1 FL=1
MLYVLFYIFLFLLQVVMLMNLECKTVSKGRMDFRYTPQLWNQIIHDTLEKMNIGSRKEKTWGAEQGCPGR